MRALEIFDQARQSLTVEAAKCTREATTITSECGGKDTLIASQLRFRAALLTLLAASLPPWSS